MIKKKESLRGIACLLVFAFVIPVSSLADDMDDVMAVIDSYIATETDLAEQARLMTDDRTYIVAGRRFTDNVANMRGQLAGEKLRQELDPDGTMIVTAEDPMIKVYGDTAVASFNQPHWWLTPGADAVKAGQAGNAPPSQVVTVVLNKHRGDWQIVHTHISPMGGN
ncbi:MAG: nuclear transport factor 2 family protein [Woeseiaceae bacterium]|nr:nuclear transport factor 2 family protein [Woeseiaceae bacterium]